MKLELEMQELEQVWYGLDGSAKLLDELAKVLNKHQKAEKTWEGSGRDAYDTLEDQLKHCAESCGARLRGSVNAMVRSLNLYYGLETQLDKFRQQYPHIEMRFRLLENDAVADGVEQGELDAGLVMDLGTAAKEELTYLIEALEQVQTALPGCWESPNTQRYMEKLERVLQSARRNCNSLEDIRKELRQTADDAEAAEREIQQKFGFLFPDKNV